MVPDFKAQNDWLISKTSKIFPRRDRIDFKLKKKRKKTKKMYLSKN